MYTVNLIIFIGIIIALLVLSIVTTRIVIESSIHSSAEKKRLILLIWLLPIVGALLSVSRIKKDERHVREQADQAMVNKLDELTGKIDAMRLQVEHEKKRKMH
ncbi:MAG: hypothetical protein ACC707_06900 [Thiohalomonadales bacterium]